MDKWKPDNACNTDTTLQGVDYINSTKCGNTEEETVDCKVGNGNSTVKNENSENESVSIIVGSDSGNVGTVYDKAENSNSNVEDSKSRHNYAEDPSLSPEEKETFTSISRELDLLCLATQDDSQSVRYYTGPYGRIQSPFKRFSSFHAYPSGVKRSPRKSNGPAPKRTKLFHEDVEEKVVEASSSSDEGNDTQKATSDIVKQVLNTMEDVEGSGEDSSEEDKWEIVEDEISTDFDNKLEDKSTKFSLSAMNVKSIIHKIVTNENVVEMVRKAVQEEIVENDIKFEPKMTRSKLKEIEAKGQFHSNWGLSPRKKRVSPIFLDMELPEDEEDDEDFNPDKHVGESDEDSESLHSSYIGSPLPSTPTRSLPTTPTLSSNLPKTLTRTTPSNDENSSQSFLSPMGPPLQTTVPKSNPRHCSLGQKFREAMEKDAQQEEEELIARRTRSKYSLNDCSILDLEANFVAPDITPDMYDTTCDDTDWRDFLTGFILPEEIITSTVGDIDDPENDPEYDYIGDSNTVEVDDEDYRNDRAVKVSRKEVNELLDDILSSEMETDLLDDQYKINIKSQSEKIVLDSNKKKQKVYQKSLISEIGDYERRQIDDQLRKHVQQLAQTYVMVQNGNKEHVEYGERVKSLLIELDTLGKKTVEQDGMSTFTVCNLQSALSLVNDETWLNIPELSDEDKDRLNAIPYKYDVQTLPSFSYQQINVMWNSPVFMFPELLPHGGFFKAVDIKKDRANVKFLEAEDNLLAMGIAQFNHLKKESKDYIRRFMLPCKTRKQIEIRIKNLKSTAAKDNSVKFYSTYKMLPKFPQHAPLFDISMMKAPKDSTCKWHELPVWCKFFCSQTEFGLKESTLEKKIRRRAVKERRKAERLASLSVSEPNISNMCVSPFLSISAPVTPRSKVNSNEYDTSSESSPDPSPRKEIPGKAMDAEKPLLSQFTSLPGSTNVAVYMLNNGQLTQVPVSGSSVIQIAPQIPGNAVMPVTLNIPGNSAMPTASHVPGSSIIPANSVTSPVIVINQNETMNIAHVQTSSQSMDAPIASDCDKLITKSPKYESEDCGTLTFEDICRPIMEAELGESVTLKQCGNVKNTLKSKLNKNLNGNNNSKSDIVPGGSLDDYPIDPNLDLLADDINLEDIDNEALGQGQILTSTQQDGANTSIPETDLVPPGSGLLSMPVISSSVTEAEWPENTGNMEGYNQPTQSPVENSDLTSFVQCSNNSKWTPERKHGNTIDSSIQKSPKSCLEVVASLAPYFMSPVQSIDCLTQQQRLETTPTKNRCPIIAPKPSPITLQSPIKFHRSPRKYVRKSSPRKKQLQQQVQTILPKGFVISTYDTSPTKKAASVLVDRAKHIANLNHSPGVRKILPGPANLQRPIDLIKISSRPRRKKRSYKKSGNSSTVDEMNVSKDVISDCQPVDRVDSINKTVDSTVVIGDSTAANGTAAVAMGDSTVAMGDSTVAMGNSTVAIGDSTIAMGDSTVAMGNSLAAMSDSTVGVGYASDGLGNSTVAMGDDISVKDKESIYMLDDMNEPIDSMVAMEDDERCGDTESDYTQSEDGNDTQGTDCDDIDTQGTDDGDITQGTDGESQDSQEEDDIIVNDNLAKTTEESFVPSKSYLYSRARHVKKDRNRDVALTLLEPDIVESDPQRDLRDTLFAQAYIHKVKKTLKDDYEKLEAFLKIMCNFSKEGESPIKLYGDLKELFHDYRELMDDFAGFLQREQAVECGCYKAYQEFQQARTFLRKLQLYFSKNPNQLQKVMRTFSRWFKKPGRNDTDLREQIEPMLKGQKILLDEFASFFPDEKPSESLMDDFEEINLDDSGDNSVEDKESSVEEIDLLELEDVIGTKRCTCSCHDSGDDTIRKRKKHCYTCGLTVIDGELVYKVNKSTIKKINVKFGPKLSSLTVNGPSEEITGPVQQERINDICSDVHTRPQVAHDADLLQQSDNTETENMESVKEETLTESPDKINNQEKSPLSNVTASQQIRKPSHCSSSCKQVEKSPELKETSSQVDESIGVGYEEMTEASETIVMETSNVEPMEVDNTNNEDFKNENQASTDTNLGNTSVARNETPEHTTESLNDENNVRERTLVHDKQECIVDTEENCLRLEPNDDNDESCGTTVKERKIDLGEDILASAFTSAMNTEVSMDSVSLPFSVKEHVTKTHSLLNHPNESGDTSVNIPDKATFPMKEQSIPAQMEKSFVSSAPVGLNILHVSSDSSFSKVTSAPCTSNLDDKQESQNDSRTNLQSSKQKFDRSISLTQKPDIVSDASRSPPFSPFSPFALEIQNITSAQSPLSAVTSPGICRSLSTSSKVRRITPIPVKDVDAMEKSPLAFQTAMKNSPVLPELQCTNSAGEKQIHTGNSEQCGMEATTSVAEPSNKPCVDGKTDSVTAFTGTDSQSNSQKSEQSSQKSSSSSGSTGINTGADSAQGTITISQPELYSENANVGFPKSVSNTSVTHGGILSEESLFHCLSKPPQFADTLNTVSGLTNILNALDEKTLHQNIDSSKSETDGNGSQQGLPFGGCDNKIEKDSEQHESHDTDNRHMERLDHNTKDGDNSNDSKENHTVCSDVQEIAECYNQVSVPVEESGINVRTSSIDELDKKIENSAIKDKQSSISDLMNSDRDTVTSGKNVRKSKMSRRELRRSLQGKDIEQNVSDSPDVNHESSESEGEKLQFSPDVSDTLELDKDKNVDKTNDNVITESSESNQSAENTQVNADTNVLDGDRISDEVVVSGECDSIEVKVELDNDGTEETVYSDIPSVSDTLSETSSKGRKKSKHKHKNKSDRKKKRRKDDDESEHKHNKHKKKKDKKREERSNTTMSPAGEVKSGVTTEDSTFRMEDTESVAKADSMERTQSPVTSDNMEIEPDWTKEIDKTILEACKVHGIKEKTFIKIAKQIGNVTPKQVRKRFSTLYQIIFGVPLPEINQ
ncbi:Paired amphipathic helix repeat [Mactra antiquata]